jgi:hypothetical protein
MAEVRLFDDFAKAKLEVYSHVSASSRERHNSEQLALACNGYYRCQPYAEFPITIVEFGVPVHELDVSGLPKSSDSNRLRDLLELACGVCILKSYLYRRLIERERKLLNLSCRLNQVFHVLECMHSASRQVCFYIQSTYKRFIMNFSI